MESNTTRVFLSLLCKGNKRPSQTSSKHDKKGIYETSYKTSVVQISKKQHHHQYPSKIII